MSYTLREPGTPVPIETLPDLDPAALHTPHIRIHWIEPLNGDAPGVVFSAGVSIAHQNDRPIKFTVRDGLIDPQIPAGWNHRDRWAELIAAALLRQWDVSPAAGPKPQPPALAASAPVAPAPAVTRAERIKTASRHIEVMDALASWWGDLRAPDRPAAAWRAAVAELDGIAGALAERADHIERTRGAAARPTAEFTLKAPADAEAADLRSAAARFVALRDNLAAQLPEIEAKEAVARAALTARIAALADDYKRHNETIMPAFDAAAPLIEAAATAARLQRELTNIYQAARLAGLDMRSLMPDPIGPTYRVTIETFGNDGNLATMLKIPGIAAPGTAVAPPWAYRGGMPS